MKVWTIIACLLMYWDSCLTQSSYDWQQLDATNLKTLNRETRKNLLEIVTREIKEAKSTLDTLRPELLECQTKIWQAMGQCMDCVNKNCNRFKACSGFANIVIPNGSGVSVSSKTDQHGRYFVTVCAVLFDNSKVCQTIMNPDGVMSSSITNIGNNLLVNLRGAMSDMGGNSIGTFVNGMQTFIGNYHPLVGNMSSFNETEVKKMFEEMNKQYRAINRQVNAQMKIMNENLRRNNAERSRRLKLQMRQLNANLRQMNQNIRNNVHQQNMQLNRQMQNMNQNLNNMNRQFNQNMNSFSTNLNRQMQQMSSNLNNMFQGGWFGRKKRSAKSKVAKRAVGDCGLIVLNMTSCLQYKEKCQACAENIDSKKNDIMLKECGAPLVNNLTVIQHALEETQRLYDQVIFSKDLITKVMFDPASGVDIMNGFTVVNVTTEVEGKVLSFQTVNPLKLLDLPATGSQFAEEIWQKWTV